MNIENNNSEFIQVSVVIPLYNKNKYIARALDSILSQTYQHFEIVVIDDGSTDDSPEIVRSYSDSRIKLIKQENAGPGAARNRGIKESVYPLVGFLDADDEWMPNFLEESVTRLKNNSDCVLSVFGHFRGTKKESWEPKYTKLGINKGVWRMPTKMESHLLKPNLDFFHSSAIVAYRDILNQFGGFYEKNHCNYGEDIYLWLQIALNYKVYRDPKPLMWYHTETSELGMFNRENLPIVPIITEPQPIHKNCPQEYQNILEHYLARYAILTASRCIKAGDSETARNILKEFPLTKTLFTKDYLKAQLEILLIPFPKLRKKIRQGKQLFKS